MNAPLLVRLLGSWPGCIVLALLGILVFFAGVKAGDIIAIGIGAGMVLTGFRMRSRLSEYQRFNAQWQRVAGNQATAAKPSLESRMLPLSILVGIGAAGTYLYLVDEWHKNTPPPYDVRPDEISVALYVAAGALVVAVILGLEKIAGPLRLQRARKAAEGKFVDGKPMPKEIATPALGVPSSTPSPAAIAKQLPAYCLPLLDSSVRRVIDAHAASDGDEGSINEAAPAAELTGASTAAMTTDQALVRAAKVLALETIGKTSKDGVTADKALGDLAKVAWKENKSDPVLMFMVALLVLGGGWRLYDYYKDQQRASAAASYTRQPGEKNPFLHDEPARPLASAAAPPTELAPPAVPPALSGSPSPTTGDVLDRANAGDMEAQYQVGMSMIRVASRTDDPAKKADTLAMGQSYLTLAASKGHVAAQQELAKLAPPQPRALPSPQAQARDEPTPAPVTNAPPRAEMASPMSDVERSLRAQLQYDIDQRLKDAAAGKEVASNRRIAKIEQELLKRSHITVDDMRDALSGAAK